MSVQVSYKKQFIFFIMLFFILLVITEVAIRYVETFEPSCMFTNSEIFSNYNNLEKDQMCFEYKSVELDYSQPFAIAKPNQIGDYVNINSDGYRGKEISDESKYRIIFLGGSTVFGTVTTSDETTIPAFVEKKLNEKKFNVHVINAGIPSATSIDEIYLLENDLLKYDPDLVIMYDGWNDITERNKIKFNIQYEEFKNNSYVENVAEFSNKENTIQNISIKKIFNFLVDIDYRTGVGLAMLIRDNFISNADINEIKNSENISDLKLIEERLGNNWGKVCNLGKENSFKTVNFIQPGIETSSRNLSNEEIILISQTTQITEMNYLKKMDVEKLGNNSCENITDLRNTFDNINNKTIFFDPIHVSDYGNEIISEKIVSIIIPIIKEDF